MAGRLVIMYWRDIPAQVSAQSGRNRQAGLLDERFEKDIDRAAMVAGLVGSDEYLAQWRRTSRSCGDDLQAEAAAEVERITTEYTRERVNAFVLNGGFDPDRPPAIPHGSATTDHPEESESPS